VNRLLSSLLGVVLALGLSFGLSGCVTTGLAVTPTSPWQPVALDTKASPLDLAFTDDRHGFLVGSNRLILETEDGGASWQERSLDLPEGDNYRLLSVDFKGQEGWIAGQPGLLLRTGDGGQNWERLLLDTKLPGEPYLVTALGAKQAELATSVGAIYRTDDGGASWQADVSDAAGAVRDLRRSRTGVTSVCRALATSSPPGIRAKRPGNPISGSAASGCRAWVLNRTVASGWSPVAPSCASTAMRPIRRTGANR